MAWSDGVRERELRGHEANVVMLSIDGPLLASKDSSNLVRVWDLRDAECIQTLQLSAGSSWALLRGNMLAVAVRQVGVELWHVREGVQHCKLDRAYIGWMQWCAPSCLLMLACDSVPTGGSETKAQPECSA